MTSRKIVFLALILATILSAGFFVFLFQREAQIRPLPILGGVQDFLLYDAHGQEVTLESLKGKIWVADFIFTTCSGICPVMTGHMLSLHRSFLLDDNVRMVSFSVNPEQDSPEVLAQYAKKYKVDFRKWHFLTGDPQVIQKLSLESFKIGSVKEPIFHSDRFVLVDFQARIRGYYEGTSKNKINLLFRDIARLLKERI